ncbi:ABC transporter substrate-binding protein [Paenibacillus eucommiae]|uniref:ABC-type Fe3+-hydroxamate transport system substrate-binding protein n=1 Tax=Paenibacillus eucommiae TaxID=1355755 RepID=A0ABS4ISF6_9BACL|nr:ABC transporter substrate-binding protein [Paenibacillus eucommiae]MBP1990510.1 ABC-type Fe3+-hydroxamate transport system substrate-binding protein [Paenibacillus eucommiae]
MLQDTPSSVPLRSLLFHLSDVELHARPPGWTFEEATCSSYTLLIFTNGTGGLHIDDQCFRFFPDHCYLFPPGVSLQIENGTDNAICFYQLSFTVIHAGEQQQALYTKDIFPKRELRVYPISRLIRLTEQLHAGRLGHSDLEWFKQHLHFQELMGFLLEHNLHSDPSLSLTQSVEETIHYLQNNYMSSITVKLLAQLSNVPHWQYTSIFQELTGKKPLDYLTELRINRSKEWLANSNAPLRDIAQRVGFTDEYYFNRRFRQTTGITPRQYALSMRRKVLVKDWTGHEVHIPTEPSRIIYFGENMGDLLTLGIHPVGGSLTSYKYAMHTDSAKSIQDIGFPFNTERASALEPDLIIFSNSDERQYEQISKIAPTITYNTWATLEERMLVLGEWFGKKREAEQWLARHNRKAQTMWHQLKSSMEPGETASVFTYERGRHLFVMGVTGLSSALYHPSGFRPANNIQAILDAKLGYKEIRPSLLPQYAGDRIFMLLPENPVSRQAAEDMIQSSLWQSLPAVRNGYVYLIEEAQWNFADALTREKLLDMLPDLLGKSS